jgi:hypothetical protein
MRKIFIAPGTIFGSNGEGYDLHYVQGRKRQEAIDRFN